MEIWKKIPSIGFGGHPNEIAKELKAKTGREVKLRNYDVFLRDFSRDVSQSIKSPDELVPYGILTVFFPRCLTAVLDGSETVERSRKDPLIFLVRPFNGCDHALSALYEFHPVNDSPWNDGLYDHVRMWTWTKCEVCEANELKAKRAVS